MYGYFQPEKLPLSLSLGDDDGLVDARPVLSLPERGPEVRLNRVGGWAGEVRIANMQVRLEDAFVVRDHVLGHLE